MVVFGAPGSAKILTHNPVWEGRDGSRSCEGLVNLTGDRSEGSLQGHTSPSSHHLQRGWCPRWGEDLQRCASDVGTPESTTARSAHSHIQTAITGSVPSLGTALQE